MAELWPLGAALHAPAYVPPALAGSAFVFEADFSAFLREFSEPVARADGTVFSAIFDLSYVDPLGVAGSNPRITAPVAAPVSRDEIVTVRERAYRVQTIEPDGTGWYSAELQRA